MNIFFIIHYHFLGMIHISDINNSVFTLINIYSFIHHFVKQLLIQKLQVIHVEIFY